MNQATFQFHGNLNDFLPVKRRQIEFFSPIKEEGSVKDAIESLGVPHPEIDLVMVNGDAVGFDYRVKPGDRIVAYPYDPAREPVPTVRPQPLIEARFVLDVHLGKLARYLRMLGFDALYQNDYDDETLADISSQQRRILLTHDVGLLKRKIVDYGYWVRSPQPKQQVREVLSRFDLYKRVEPWTRCSRCNGLVMAVEKEVIRDRLPYYTALSYHTFFKCKTCAQLYWKGAHYSRMQTLIEDLSTA